MKNKILVVTLAMILCIGSACLSFAGNATTIFDGLTIDGTKNSNDVYTDEITFTYSAEDEDGVKGVSLAFGDKEVAAKDYSKDADGNAVELQNSVEGTFVIDKETLSENEPENYEYQAQFVIVDANDQITSKPFTFKADASAPQIKLEGLGKGTSYNEAQELKVTVTDNNTENLTYDVKVTFDGEEDENKEGLAADKEFEYKANDAGTYVIEVTATDANGNVSEFKRGFVIDKTGPAIIDAKTTGSTNDGYTAYNDASDIKLTAKIQDKDTGLVKIDVMINDEKYEVYDLNGENDENTSLPTTEDLETTIKTSWIKEHASDNANYIVKIIAEDDAGNKSVEEISFEADMEAPQFRVDGAENGKIYNSYDDLFVTGTANDNYNENIYVKFTVRKDGEVHDSGNIKGKTATYEITEDGAYEIYMHAVDMAGNKSETKEISFKCDTVGPVIKDYLLTGNNVNDIYNDEVKIDFAAEDLLTCLESIKVTVNDVSIFEDIIDVDNLGTKRVMKTLTKEWLKENASDDLSYEVVIEATDKAGNKTTKTDSFKADTVAPVVELSGAENGKVYNKYEDAAVNVKATDATNNLANIKLIVTKDGGTPQETIVEENTASFIPEEDGNYEVLVKAVDQAGNASETKTVSFMCDTKGANISDITLDGEKINEYYKSGVKYTLTAEDEMTQVESIKITVNEKMLQGKVYNNIEGMVTFEGEVTEEWLKANASKDSKYVLKAIVTDAAGNKSTKEIEFLADVAAPEVTITGVKDGKAYKAAPTVTAEMTDQNVEKTEITLTIEKDGQVIDTIKETENTSVSYSAFEEDGEYKVTAKAIDIAGNESESAVVTFVYDATLPTVTCEGITSEDPAKTEWFNSAVTIKGKTEDALTGIYIVEIKVNGVSVMKEKLTQVESSKAFEAVLDKAWFVENESKDDTYTVTLAAMDMAGNIGYIEETFTADFIKPVVKLSGIEHGTFTNEKPTVKATVTDKHADKAVISYKVFKDGNLVYDENKTGNTFGYNAFEGEGVYTVKAYATDIAGNVSNEETVSFIYDAKGAAMKDLTLKGARKDGYKWYDNYVKVSTTATDPIAGLSKVTMIINGETVIDLDAKGTKETIAVEKIFNKEWFRNHASSDGKYLVKVVTYDRAGNKATRAAEFYADVTAPTITLDGIENGSFNNTKQQVTATLADDYANANTLVLNIEKDGKTYATTKKNVTTMTYASFEDNGRYKVMAKAVDAAGNESEVAAVRFVYDTKAAVIGDLKFTGKKNDGYTWFKEAVTINSLIEEPLAGLKNVNVKVNNKEVANVDFTEATYRYQIEKPLSKEWFQENESETGKYDVVVTVMDKAGNKSSKTKAFYCDVKAPKVSIDGIENGLHTNETPEITCEVTDNYKNKNTIFFESVRDGKENIPVTLEGSLLRYNKFSKDGKYYMTVLAVDKAGNKSAEKTLAFVKDTVAPVLKITGAEKDSYTIGSKNIVAHIKELNYKNAKVKANIVRTLDGKTSMLGFAGVEPNKVDYSKAVNLTKTGTYTVTLEAEDKAGNVAETQRLVFTIDNDEPIVKIEGVNSVNGYNSNVTPKVYYEDSYFKKADISISRTDGRQAKVSFRDAETAKGGTRTYSNFARIASNDGLYTITCTVTDKSGNKTTKSQRFSVNRFGSTYKMSKDSKRLNQKYINNVGNDIVITESNVTGLKDYEMIVTKDGIKQDVRTRASEGSSNGWKTYTYSFDRELFDEEGVYQVNVTSTDTVGNFSEFLTDDNSFKFCVDKTPPTIVVTGIEAGESYKGNETIATVKVNDSIKVSGYKVYCDDKIVYDSSEEKTAPETKEVVLSAGLNQTVKVVATDIAGNEDTKIIEDVTISNNFLLRLWANKPLFFGVLFGLLAAMGGIFALAKRRKKDEEEPVA